MAERDQASTPIEDMADRIRDFVDGVIDSVVGALEEALAPPPEPVRIPVRHRPYPRRR